MSFRLLVKFPLHLDVRHTTSSQILLILIAIFVTFEWSRAGVERSRLQSGIKSEGRLGVPGNMGHMTKIHQETGEHCRN